MPKFEVHIPESETVAFNVTFRVDADNWMAALKMGLLKLGEQGAYGQNLLVDIQGDNALHVTESTTGRVFQIRELTEQEAASARVKRKTIVPPAAPPPITAPVLGRPAIAPLQPSVPPPASPEPAIALDRPKPPPVPDPAPAPPSAAVTSTGGFDISVAEPLPTAEEHHWATQAAKAALASKRSPSRINLEQVVELERPTRPVSGPIGRPKEKRRDVRDEIDSVLAEVFERVQEVHSKKDVDEALYFLLDLALEKIPCESGTMFRADAGSGDLTFSTVRGPKADQLLNSKIVVPSGTGIVGFCAVEGVSVALSDVQKDPRFYGAVGEKINYETRSLICCPMMTHGRTFGCLELVNKQGSAQWGEHEIGLLSYIAHQAALYLNTAVN